MSRGQIMLLVLLSVVFGLGAVFFAKQWMDNQTTASTEVEVVERVPVVVAAMEIPVTTVIEEQHLETRLIEKSWMNDSQFRDQKDVVGKIASETLYPNEIVLSQRVSTPGEGATLAAVIPEDKRAVTIRVNDVIGVAGFLLPGNKVDVLSTVKYGQNSVNTTTVLKDIKVLAVDQTARTNDNKPVIVRAVTLEVAPKDAEKLLTAKSKGDVQLALRNPHAVEPKVIKYVPPPSVTIIKGTDTSNVRVRN
ncbi:Flp pilus assembly protein CpaB [Vibrio fluvialis]|uniref:Flp pilus assembly protein CpaB n=1 Tax=Vibrio fluvialis TaxID=676 RepID=UPI001C9BBFEA|nr:Flp pilus assembly protein CpaB [Vibrio fluvialis]EKO3468076.1 Flp pilus assembly protein CpaB [Vibrio fluvialis]MBY7844414.1 Flp pilus assembly protein CpaB [Vibrio fluvialis]MBY7864115.1 Flp pilus assembly protein CpaB [Vibrio fluvialis]MBY7930604.1 Flp pilus assembly protein CpaB [Vibrio fluvialis]MBY8090549.1 Flp pilus assembly protein CpaB [Vibrio fluvialis]